MKTVDSRELKNRLGRYLKMAARGETLTVTDGGKPVARIVPVNPKKEPRGSLEGVLKQLEAEGHLRLAKRPFRRFKPVRVKGKPLSKIILEDRG